MSQAKKRSPLSTIFLTTFIDLLGVSIVIPVLPSVFLAPDTQIVAASMALSQRELLYGLLITVFPLMQFFGAPLLGSLSDKYGRKPILIISLIGACIGYFLFAYAIQAEILWLLFIARMIPGFFGGNIAVAMSAIADISTPESKPKNFGLVGLAFGLGFILGPAIGGFLADSEVVSWFHHDTPFWFTGILTFLNIMLAWWAFPETLKEKQPNAKVSMWKSVKHIHTAFKKPNLRSVFSISLLITLGFAFFTQFFSVYLIEEFQYSEKDIGLLFGWIGIWLAITQGGLVRIISKQVTPVKVLMYSILGLSLAIFLMLLPKETWWFYVLNPLIAISYGLTSPNLTTLISEQASEKDQGEILGINQSMQSLGNIFPPLIAGYIMHIDGRLPMLIGSVVVIIAWGVLIWQRKRLETEESIS